MDHTLVTLLFGAGKTLSKKHLPIQNGVKYSTRPGCLYC